LFLVAGILLVLCKTGWAESPKGKQAPQDRWLALDKLKHLTVSAVLTGLSYNFFRYDLHNTRTDAIGLSCGFTLSLGLMKEYADSRKPKGYASFKDVVADIAGIALGILLFAETIDF